jgi:hypothetical protein
MVSPGLIVVPGSIAEGAENTFKVMLVLELNMLLNQSDTSRRSVSWDR